MGDYNKWSQEDIERVLAASREGVSTAEISKMMLRDYGVDVSPSAISGVRFRHLGEDFHKAVPKMATYREDSEDVGFAKDRVLEEHLLGNMMDKPASSDGDESVIIDYSRPLLSGGAKEALLSHKRGQCRFPYGDPQHSDYGMCGREVEGSPSSNYCEYHNGVAFDGPAAPIKLSNKDLS